MSFSVPVLQDEPDVAFPAGTIGEAAGILALAGELIAAEPGIAAAAARLLESRGADPGPAASWLLAGFSRVAAGGIACDRVLARYWRRPS